MSTLKHLIYIVTAITTTLIVSATHSPLAARGIVHFTSYFEGGAIGEVNHIRSRYSDTTHFHHFALKTRVDPPNPIDKLWPSNRWFYFMMSGVKDSVVALDIEYNDSRRAMYSYDNKTFFRFSEQESPEFNKTITKRYEQDTVFVAYFTPYLSSHYAEAMQRWQKSDHVLQFTLGESTLGAPLEMVVITENPHEGLTPNHKGEIELTERDRTKKVIYIHGRIHPSEAPSAWHLEAVVDRLTDGSAAANAMLKEAIFYILPCTNPDGVTIGYSRSNATGVNMEVNYNQSPEKTTPEIALIKGFVESLEKAGMKLDLFLNMHSQSAPKTTYWVHRAKSTSKEYNRKLMQLAASTISNNPYFKWKDLCYSNIQPKYLEGWLWGRYNGHTIAQTFETPYSYYSSNPQGEWVTIENLQEQATNTIDAITDVLDIDTPSRFRVGEPSKISGFTTRSSLRKLYFGKSHQKARWRGAQITYTTPLPKGKYSVYRWVVGRNAEEESIGANRWEYLCDIEQNNNDTIDTEHVFTAQKAGERFDDILFIRR